jgi:predicted ATPase
MITTIHISNFKSISGVEFSLNKFNCIVGMNGAGKSTLLQSIDFIAQLMRGGISNWLELRGWNYKDIQPNGKHVHLSLGIGYKLKNGSFLYWTGLFDRRSAKTIIEVAHINGFNETLFTSNRRTYTLDGKPFPINFEYQGSILSQLKDSLLPPEIREFRDALRNIRSLELLSPHLLRKRSRAQDKDIGAGGEKLSGFLASLKGEHKARLVEVLRTLYPRLQDFRVASVKGGWKRLMVTERFEDDNGNLRDLETEATQLNDGLLRILAILAQLQTAPGLLLLDEVENGINPEIIEALVDLLVTSPVQTIVTTHSPMILNYLTDEVARQSVQFVYKNPQGQTRIRPFFAQESTRAKLAWMGPGEAFVDTHLPRLAEECIALDQAETAQTAQAPETSLPPNRKGRR